MKLITICLPLFIFHHFTLCANASTHVEFVPAGNTLLERAEFKKRIIYLLVGASIAALSVKVLSSTYQSISKKMTWKKMLKDLDKDNAKDKKKLNAEVGRFMKRNAMSLIFDEILQETRLVRGDEILSTSYSCGADLEPGKAYWKSLSDNGTIYGFINEKGGTAIVNDQS